MTQSELNRAVSQATGEDINEIQQRGFSLVEAFPDDAFDLGTMDLPEPQVVDWDSPFVGTTQSFYECC